MAGDPVAAYLAKTLSLIAERNALPPTASTEIGVCDFRIASRAAALAAAVEAVLARHRHGPITILGALCPEHEACRYFSITSMEAAGIVACPDCRATVYDSCAGCGPQVRLDSCPERAAISAELVRESRPRLRESADE